MKRISLVTGAAQGIGLAIAAKLAETSDCVVLVDLDEDRLEEPLRMLRDQGHVALSMAADVGCEHSVAAVAQRCMVEAGVVNVLVNNAAVSGLREGKAVPIHQADRAYWDSVLAVNLSGVFQMCRTFAPGMIEAGWGRIINIGSAAGKVHIPFAAGAYTASKAGVIGLGWALAHELGPHGITVNTVAPGRVATAMNRSLKRSSDNLGDIPLGRAATPQDIANVVEFLASDEAAYVTGSTVDVHGGLYMN